MTAPPRETLVAPSADISRRWAIVDARLIDGDPSVPITVGGVLFDHDGIVASGPDVTATSLGSTDFVSVGGRTVIPGLIDTHVHLCWDGGPRPASTFARRLATSGALDRLAQKSALEALAGGVTTLQDLGGPPEVVFPLREPHGRRFRLPRVVAAGLVVTTPGGHGHDMGVLATRPKEVDRAVRRLVSGGSDVIKVMATGGLHTTGTDGRNAQYSVAGLRAAVSAAEAGGARITTHATGIDGVRRAIAAGIRSIQHGGPLDRPTLDMLAATDTSLTPTIATRHFLARGANDRRVPRWIVAKAAMTDAARWAAVAEAIRAGVRIVAGTDAGSTLVGHGTVLTELKLLHELGLPQRLVLAAATHHAAQELGLGDRLGSLQAGRVADLVILADELELRMDRTTEIAAVVLGGQWIDSPIPATPGEGS